jgi:hypothetical protein
MEAHCKKLKSTAPAAFDAIKKIKSSKQMKATFAKFFKDIEGMDKSNKCSYGKTIATWRMTSVTIIQTIIITEIRIRERIERERKRKAACK